MSTTTLPCPSAEKTVRNNLSMVLTKLGVADRAAAIAKARDAGLGTPS